MSCEYGYIMLYIYDAETKQACLAGTQKYVGLMSDIFYLRTL